MADVYATIDDIPESWRPRTAGKVQDAVNALELAAILIRRNVDMTNLDIDDEKLIIARHVAVDMVRPLISLADENYGKTQYSTTVGGIADSATLLNPSGTLYFTEAYKALFGIGPATVPQFHFGDC
ncbi:hypothetical protein CH267_00950 [Rhodococcus sp. 06-621-2]|nr:hypothetical protein [Rhodococcus sp. 06-621-2]OZC62141.1 hypothetical protein CH267_00950 [Rhodococcus sp. 06-621-2]